MISGPHTSATVRAGSKSTVGNRVVTTPIAPHQRAVRNVNGDLDDSSVTLPPLEVIGKSDLVWFPGPDEHEDPSGSARLIHEVADCASQRSKADASGDDDNVSVVELVYAPVGAERAPHANGRADGSRAKRVGNGADVADGVLDRPGRSRQRC